jgi:hypothetical protein
LSIFAISEGFFSLIILTMSSDNLDFTASAIFWTDGTTWHYRKSSQNHIWYWPKLWNNQDHPFTQSW